MNQEKGTIYIRDNELCRLKNIYKLGIASFAKNRDDSYNTYEHERGEFILIIEIPLDKMKIIDNLLKKYLQKERNYIGGGTEYYNRCIIDLIEPYLQQTYIEYKVLTKEEINSMNRRERLTPFIKKIKIILENLRIKRTNKKIPRSDQQIIIDKAFTYFQTNNEGIFSLTCGFGKSLLSLWIAKQLQSNTIVIGVPNKLLLKQWNTLIKELFPKIKILVVSGGVSENDIQKFLESNNKCIIVTTYSSSHKVKSVSQLINFKFDMKILDEVHHLTTMNSVSSKKSKKYIEMLYIPYIKQLSLTATLKLLETLGDKENIISNDNVERFGKIIDQKNVLWAIEHDIICDYYIQTIITNEDKLEEQFNTFNITDENDKRLFLSAYCSLKTINDGHSHHLLIYSNSMENSFKIIQYIKLLLDNYFKFSEIYYSDYHSKKNTKDKESIINNFENAPYGIITCVYCLNEGWDFPLLDAVVFAENMTSNIRIVQSALRASRKNKKDVNKKTKIILPVLIKDDWLENNENTDLRKVKEVIYQMGLEDETISQKIKVFKINIEKQKHNPTPKQIENVNEFGEYDNELTQKLRLKTTHRNALEITYEKARKINCDKKIISKESYNELCEKDNRLPKDPENHFKGRFINWIEYLSIDRVYYDLETCKNKVSEYLSINPEIKSHLNLSNVCNELCKIDGLFPPNGLWIEYYNVKELRDIINISIKKKKSGIVL